MPYTAITLFLLAINATLFTLAFKGNFHKTDWANYVIRKSMLIIAFLVLSFNIVILASFASHVGIAVTSELFFYMRIFNFTTYILMIFLFVQGGLKALQLWQIEKQRKRMGDDDE